MLKIAVNYGVQAFGIALAAFSVWLCVRICNRRERWAKRTAVIMFVILVAYPLSTGPAAWLVVHALPRTGKRAINDFYIPLGIVRMQAPEWAKDASQWYIGCWVDHDVLAKAAVEY
jgi:hypothetical protein